MKKRIILNWKSTAIGLAIAVASGLALYFKFATWDQLTGFWTVSGLLAYVKDTIFKV